MNQKANLKQGLLRGIATVVKKTSQFGADTLCMWWQYQPKKPQAVKDMQKF
ncbi:MAG: cyclic lactone autoinducer peptide [Ruminococcus sp.]|nr:cyclic lactone autoinducer peptide [Ruminococcus sp.]